MDPGHHGNRRAGLPSQWTRCHGDREQQNVLALTVLLVGEARSGRSSVGNALIGGHEFQTGSPASGGSVTTECRLLSRNFPAFFRRQGAESDLLLRVVDTPPGLPHPQSVRELCPEGVHVLAVVIRADAQHEDSQVETVAETLVGPDWRRHACLVVTHSDRLKEAGLHPTAFLSQTSDWLRALAEQVGGGVSFLDGSSDWPAISGAPLRERTLRLSASNHHRAASVRAPV